MSNPIQCQQTINCIPINFLNITQCDWQIDDDFIRSDFELANEGKDSNFTFIVNKPIRISFQWEVMNGYSFLEFFDNERSVGILGKLECDELRHENLSDIFEYIITDRRLHELKLCHRNNVGIGSARVCNICIKDNRISSIYASVQPDHGIATSMACSENRIKNAFTFKVQINAQVTPQKVELFTFAPGHQTPTPQGEGSLSDDGMFYWRDIKLKSNNCGEFQYSFRITLPDDNHLLESNMIPGPNITNVVIRADRSTSYSGNPDCWVESCWIALKGSEPKTIHLNYCDEDNNCRNSFSETYQHDRRESQSIYFNNTWCRNQTYPEGWEFELDD